MRLFPKREYKSGSRWALWRWTYTPSGYITRLHIFKTPWFALCLHMINGPDPEPYLHDHPVSFLSLILRGWYEEKRQRGTTSWVYKTHRWFNWIRASRKDRHRIVRVKPGTVTLAFMGPKRQEWGFHGVQLLDGEVVQHRGAWLHFKAYNDATYKAVQP